MQKVNYRVLAPFFRVYQISLFVSFILIHSCDIYFKMVYFYFTADIRFKVNNNAIGTILVVVLK